MSWTLHIGDESPVDGHTYNLSAMWRLSGMFDLSSRELGGLPPREIAARAEKALVRAVRFKESFEALNPENGWGDYDGFVETLFKLWRCAAVAPRDAKVEWYG